jgi:hypothetical protein
MDEGHADHLVKTLCDVTSKADLKPHTFAGDEWARLEQDFRDWMQEPVL